MFFLNFRIQQKMRKKQIHRILINQRNKKESVYFYFFLVRALMSQITNAIMATTTNTPTHTPALKIAPTTSHEVKRKANKERSKM